MSRVGDTIKNARLKSGVTQKALAKKLGVAEKYINEVEIGKRVVPENFIDRVSKVLNVNLNEISMVVTDEDLKKEEKENAVLKKAEEKKPKTFRTLGETSEVWTEAFSSVLKKVNIYDYNMKRVFGSKDLPIFSNKVEGHAADKVVYFKVEDNDMAGFRIMKGDLAFGFLTKDASKNGIYLIENKGKRVLRQIKTLGNSRVLLISNEGSVNTETVELNSIKIIAKITRIQILL